MYYDKKKVALPYAEAVERTKEELKKEGFGVLMEIDVQKTLKEKIGVTFDKYVILGACNPPSAHKALNLERDIGLLLPCNVIVYETGKETFISTILPTVTMGMIDNDDFKTLATEIERKLKNAVNNV